MYVLIYIKDLSLLPTAEQGRGDRKFTPPLSSEDLKKISCISEHAESLYKEFSEYIFTKPPFNLGFPSEVAQSAYYPSHDRIDQHEINKINQILGEKGIHPENTRVEKQWNSGRTTLRVIQASADKNKKASSLFSSEDCEVVLDCGDHSEELRKICECLKEARNYSANPIQKQIISKYIESFSTGDMEAYRDSQRLWVKDRKPAVETIIGFVEPYRDPSGVRAEFEGVVGIVDPNETKVLTALTESSTKFIRRLPWAKGYGEDENRGMGPFEKDLFDPPDFTSLQGKTAYI